MKKKFGKQLNQIKADQKQHAERLKKQTYQKSLVTKKDDMKKRFMMPYSTKQTILLVGEGNFSFASALATKLESGEKITATVFDSEDVMKEKYTDAHEFRDAFKEMDGKCIYSVDATELHNIKAFKTTLFDVVVFNFPHRKRL